MLHKKTLHSTNPLALFLQQGRSNRGSPLLAIGSEFHGFQIYVLQGPLV